MEPDTAKFPSVERENFRSPVPVDIIKLGTVALSNPTCQAKVSDANDALGPRELLYVAVFTSDVFMLNGELNFNGVLMPVIDSAKSNLRISFDIIPFAENVPTKDAFPIVVSPNADAVSTSVLIKSFNTLVLSSQF
jgi:hypothetical protein